MPAQKDIENITEILAKAPEVLQKLILEIPVKIQKVERIKGKWCIHAHAVHIIIAQSMIIERMERFIKEKNPVFQPYFPDKVSPETDLLELNLKEMLLRFAEQREKLLSLCKNQPESFWLKEASHPEYKIYTPFIMLRHIMMHDQLHMYRIEELWLTKDEYLPIK
jgi:hypothetical protein